MATYFSVLMAAKAAIEAIDGLAGAKVVVRPEVAFLKDAGDEAPIVILAPRRDRWEQVADLFFDGANSHQGGVRLDMAVVVALVIENRFDLQQLEWQLNRREDVRRALWDARAVSGAVSTVTDCAYDPSPRGVDLSALAPPLDASLQQFTFRSDEARYAP